MSHIIVPTYSSGGSDLLRAEFTTDGSGAATVAALIGKNVDVWIYQAGEQGILLSPDGSPADYDFNTLTGAFTGLAATTKYLVYAY